MIGTFRQPEFVMICPDVLHTLPTVRRSEGFAELIKHAFISDAALVDDIERDLDVLMTLSDRDRVEEILHRSVNIKAQIVAGDPTEADSRMLLNFGHTLGHALEKTTHISHGQAVAVGMVTAARMSQRRGWLTEDDVERLIAILDRAGLPTRASSSDPRKIMDALSKDKKRRQDVFHVVMLKGLGHAVVEPVTGAELNEWVDDLCQSRGAQP
ncbi:D-3-phosphoglycerate dehydrogenase [Platysternon megacephalum]|uniref:D-3-phosphoglycerate dehydrogenase n=1 Tax=Platysternon megacephalum TaxID=55544 RepID=A0A4D9DDJ9_9SAUR|nr:D-3-phosphoglycerate dehydrogenase [Platysternon megacephalum]